MHAAPQPNRRPQLPSAAGLRNISNDSGISACATNSPGSAYSSPSGPLPTASLPRRHQKRPVRVKPSPSPAPKLVSHQPDWSVESWTTDELFDSIPKQTHSRFQSSPVVLSSAIQPPFDRHSRNHRGVTRPTRGWTASSGEEAADADIGCNEPPDEAASTCMEQQWSRVHNSEHAQFTFIKNLFARRPSQDSISKMSGIEAGGLSSCQSSQFQLDADLAAVTSPSVVSPCRTTSDDLHCLLDGSSRPGVPLDSPPHTCYSPPPFRRPKPLTHSLTTDSIRTQNSSAPRLHTVLSRKRSLSDRAQSDWLEVDVSQSCQNEWNAKVAKLATLDEEIKGKVAEMKIVGVFLWKWKSALNGGGSVGW